MGTLISTEPKLEDSLQKDDSVIHELYDDNYNLLAVGKLSSPLQTSPLIDTTILISLDR